VRIGLIAPPFIPVPPVNYGGTELFIANLARGLTLRGHDVTVYANGESRVAGRLKWRYPHSDWPVTDPRRAELKNQDHTAWAMRDAAITVDVVHLNDVTGLPFTHFTDLPVVLTLHHPHEPWLSEQYARYPNVEYVTIAAWLAQHETMSRLHVVHHGIPLDDYVVSSGKDDYVAFLGRMVPCKGPHLAIEAARRAGIHLKLAGEVQPIFRDYWERQIAPLVDGRQIEYIGEVDAAQKNALLSRARALLFPIQWQEPFGLVLIEAMACGTPVLAFAGGAVAEIVENGVNGWICRDVDEMAGRIVAPLPQSTSCRDTVASKFSLERMVDAYLRLYQQLVPNVDPVTETRRSHGRYERGTGPVLHSGERLEGYGADVGPAP